MKKKYIESIVHHYEECLDKHGDNHLGVDWPNEEDVAKRYRVMLDIVNYPAGERREKVSVLDFGCGASHLLSYILEKKMTNILYAGLDISEKFISLSKSKFPDTKFYCTDILNGDHGIPSFDYIIMNGVFTAKRSLTFEEMWAYFTNMLTKVYALAKIGIAVNFMSKAVDWERHDLFHLSMDKLAEHLVKTCSRNFTIRNDYGLYEYTVYIYK